MNSVYKFLLSCSPQIQKQLIQELKYLEIKARPVPGFNELMIQTNFYGLYNILHKSRLVENIKLQIGKKLKVKGIKDLEKSLEKQPFHAFLPISDLQIKYDIPTIRCKSFRSNLYHEKFIKDFIEKFFKLSPIRKSYTELKKIGYDGEIKNLESEIQKKKKLLKQYQQKQIQGPIVDKIDGNKNIQQISDKQKLLDLVFYLRKDVLTSMIQLNHDNLYKHGYKKRVNYAPIKENIATIAIQFIIDDLKDDEFVKLWDPFCGSGTILLEFLSMYLDRPIRMNYDTQLIERIPIFDKKDYQLFKDGLIKNSEDKTREIINNRQKLQIIGSDISSQYIDITNQNFINSDLYDVLKKINDGQNHSNQVTMPHLNQNSFFNDMIKFMALDFEQVYKTFIKDLTGYTIVTNLPYGVRSAAKTDQFELENIYLRFSKLIKKNLTKLKNVYVFIKLPESKLHRDHFLIKSKLVWKFKQEFSVGSFSIGLFQLDIEASKTKQQFEVTFEQNQLQQFVKPRSLQSQEEIQQRQLQIFEKKQKNKQGEKEEFLSKFKESSKMIEIIKSKLSKYILKRSNKRKFVRAIVHKQRIEWVRRQRLNQVLKYRQLQVKKQEQEIQQKKENNRLVIAQKLVKDSLKGMDPEQQQETFEKIQEQLDKKSNKKEIKYQELKRKRIKKIPSWQ